MDRMRGRREGDRYDGPSVLRLHGHRCRDVVRHFTGWPQAEACEASQTGLPAPCPVKNKNTPFTAFLSRDTRQERERSRAGRASKNVERRQTWTRT